MSDRQPYTPPTLTRVVLQPTQAVLSPCATNASQAMSSDTSTCIRDGAGNNCKKSALGGGDSAAQS